jgi:hypothetical protein
MSARFTTDATTDDLRAELIEDDMDDLHHGLIDEVIATYPDEFRELARRYITRSWANDADVWDEATDRGYFTADHDD